MLVPLARMMWQPKKGGGGSAGRWYGTTSHPTQLYQYKKIFNLKTSIKKHYIHITPIKTSLLLSFERVYQVKTSLHKLFVQKYPLKTQLYKNYELLKNIKITNYECLFNLLYDYNKNTELLEKISLFGTLDKRNLLKSLECLEYRAINNIKIINFKY
jgi:hypothetical protein